MKLTPNGVGYWTEVHGQRLELHNAGRYNRLYSGTDQQWQAHSPSGKLVEWARTLRELKARLERTAQSELARRVSQ